MNPENLELSTWRNEAPSPELRARVLEAARPRRSDLRRAPRLLLAGAMLGSFGVAAFLATVPARAEATPSAKVLIEKAQTALQAAPRVHIREYVGGVVTAELWSEDGNQAIIWSSVHKNQKVVDILSKEGQGNGGIPWGMSYSNDGRTMYLDATRAAEEHDYRMESLAPEFFPKGAVIEYKEVGAGPTAQVSTRTVEVTSPALPNVRQRWTIRQGDGLPVRLSRERRVQSHWREMVRVTFDYPAAFPPNIFDPGAPSQKVAEAPVQRSN